MTKLYEAEVSRLVHDLTPLMFKLYARNKVPGNACVETVTDAHLSAVLKLHEEFSCPASIARLRLAGKASGGNYCRLRSRVLTLDKDVVGAFLVQSDNTPDVAFIYGVVVAKRLRGTWASVFLKYTTLSHLSASGVSFVRFQAEETKRDTHKHAARVNAKVLARPIKPETTKAEKGEQKRKASIIYSTAQSDESMIDLARIGFASFPSLIEPSLVIKLHDSTLAYPSRRVTCGDRAISFSERILDTNCDLMRFLSSEPILDLLSRCTGRQSTEINTIRAWTSSYAVGQFINKHRDRSGDIQLILGLRSARPENGGALHLSYQNKERSIFLNPGDAIVFRATEVDHWTIPLTPTQEIPLPERVVGVARYYYNSD